jgi:hypothetical protein
VYCTEFSGGAISPENQALALNALVLPRNRVAASGTSDEPPAESLWKIDGA